MSSEALIIESPAPADACVIWLHGLGADRYDFVPVVRALELPADHRVRFIFPQAPTRPVTINNGFPMPCWFDILAISPQRVMNTQQLDESVAMVRELVAQQMAQGIAAERIVLAGFSRAAPSSCVRRSTASCRWPVSWPCPLCPDTGRGAGTAQGPGPEVFVAHGEYDDILHANLGREVHDLMAAAGHRCQWHAYAMGHEVCPQEIGDIRQWLSGRLGLR